ncbi:monovalent cation/H(+) antiporter subunit G [Neobacillus vireti]|uniref:Na(+)/H(+) antiporter subunit G n=1 Tax=Neobacillus vireti LMG 21834 TaxID=1131730 RepID=A0AB94IS80_9BACI|nr:monovalent cation/H(+) antiporter subunit G [Neobacillus vireti]ETI69886.1 Na(+)/H(+) antiporter subunit G [Neobacillus vireti LMG 21834]KLT18170.1 cation:proton antiporter [Neobacillus vireti]
MIEIVKLIVLFLIMVGAFLNLVAALGVIRLPDVYTRNHAASKASALGIMSILLGTFLYFYFINHHFNSRILLGIAFFFLTTPVAGHLIGRASYNSGVKLWDKSVQDDLKRSKNNTEIRE